MAPPPASGHRRRLSSASPGGALHRHQQEVLAVAGDEPERHGSFSSSSSSSSSPPSSSSCCDVAAGAAASGNATGTATSRCSRAGTIASIARTPSSSSACGGRDLPVKQQLPPPAMPIHGGSTHTEATEATTVSAAGTALSYRASATSSPPTSSRSSTLLLREMDSFASCSTASVPSPPQQQCPLSSAMDEEAAGAVVGSNGVDHPFGTATGARTRACSFAAAAASSATGASATTPRADRNVIRTPLGSSPCFAPGGASAALSAAASCSSACCSASSSSTMAAAVAAAAVSSASATAADEASESQVLLRSQVLVLMARCFSSGDGVGTGCAKGHHQSSASVTNAITSNSQQGGGGGGGFFRIGSIIGAWYLVSVVAIVTTKLLLEGWNVPPILLTCQQLFLSSTLLRLKLSFYSGGAQPIVFPASSFFSGWFPKVAGGKRICGGSSTTNTAAPGSGGGGTGAAGVSATPALEFIVLAGIFNALDFLASNTAFGASAASFVETVKASDPISTTAVALAFKVDKIASRHELVSLALLVAGLFLSTCGNVEAQQSGDDGAAADTGAASNSVESAVAADGNETDKWVESTWAAALVVSANFCFAFRAMAQKIYRRRCDQLISGGDDDLNTGAAASCAAAENGTSGGFLCAQDEEETAKQQQLQTPQQLDDENLLCRMQQVGWMSLLIPAFLYYHDAMWDYSERSPFMDESFWQYVQVSLLNAVAYAVYNFSSSYILSNLTVLQHSTLNCLRRLFAIVSTCVFFGVPLTITGAIGVLTSFSGFCGFTYHRSIRKRKEDKHEK